MGTSEPKTSNVVDVLYPVGKILTLDANIAGDSSDQQKTIQLKIKRQQLPYTLSSGSVVEEVSDFLDKTEGNVQFLKMFDRRAAVDLRDEKRADPWSENNDNEYAKGVQSGKVATFSEQLHWNVPYYVEDGDSDWDEAEDEAFIDDEERKLYEAEIAVYDRLKEYQGICIPKILATVKLDIPPPNAALTAQQRELHQQKGLLLQYLPGPTIQEMIVETPDAPWRNIVDQALKIVSILGDHDVLNKDMRLENLIVVPKNDTYQVFMIDFGLSRLRYPGEPIEDWGRAKSDCDEEGFVGLMMQIKLKKIGIEINYESSERWSEWADREQPLGSKPSSCGTTHCYSIKE
ncbi:hypothetical protein ACHAO7_006749 [Fusarium culmorum]